MQGQILRTARFMAGVFIQKKRNLLTGDSSFCITNLFLRTYSEHSGKCHHTIRQSVE